MKFYDLEPRKILSGITQYELMHPPDLDRLVSRYVHSNARATRPARKRRR